MQSRILLSLIAFLNLFNTYSQSLDDLRERFKTESARQRIETCLDIFDLGVKPDTSIQYLEKARLIAKGR